MTRKCVDNLFKVLKLNMLGQFWIRCIFKQEVKNYKNQESIKQEHEKIKIGVQRKALVQLQSTLFRQKL